MRAYATLAVCLALGGCAAARPAPLTTPAEEVSAARTEERALRETAREQQERIRELEAQLALAHADARALRAELREMETSARRETTRIEHDEPAPIQEPPPASGPRPVLRLYGPAQLERSVEPLPGPPAPAVAAAPPPASLRLPVTASPGGDPDMGVPRIPHAPIVVAPPTRAPAARADSEEDEAVRAYRAALAHVTARRLDEALVELEAFLRAHPDHAYADNAMYWRGEIHYARRDYRRALGALSALVERYPSGNKTPEALLRIGLCHARMGDPARARQVFERLRAQYPESVAARMASSPLES